MAVWWAVKLRFSNLNFWVWYYHPPNFAMNLKAGTAYPQHEPNKYAVLKMYSTFHSSFEKAKSAQGIQC
ncbi:hypothetical protein XELAEV_18018623mg [Xenopus laevis]|uniref:Uncharacterized protein n=1 Tax=Xenopus laevis TaxID=8355 RepID=A0A974DDE2_XENLA|nr:hypothetical protein XELAEV_18018623mg [Xenopus laevis]